MALSKIDVANMLTGSTPVANGGTGLTSGTSGQFLKFTGSTTLASAADNAGKILQVVHATDNSVQSSTTTSFASLISLNITPANTNNKIFLIANAGEPDLLDGRAALRFYKAGSWIGSSTHARMNAEYGRGLGHSGDEKHEANATGFYMDTAGGTSQITYALYFARTQSSGTVRFGNGSPCNLTAMEISA